MGRDPDFEVLWPLSRDDYLFVGAEDPHPPLSQRTHVIARVEMHLTRKYQSLRTIAGKMGVIDARNGLANVSHALAILVSYDVAQRVQRGQPPRWFYRRRKV